MTDSATMTLEQASDEIKLALREYIEATYHISDPTIVRLRRRKLEEPGVIAQTAYIESTRRYQTERTFDQLGLPTAAESILLKGAEKTSNGRLLFNPPYSHQARSLVEILVEKKSTVVMTGTGSGKTESFLLPILGKLADEAYRDPQGFEDERAVRAMILYPMNALVNDQLGRLRLLFGSEAIAGQFVEWANRPARFARYTSRTLYPGVRDAKKDQRRLKPLYDFFVKSMDLVDDLDASPEERSRASDLVLELRQRGKWPAKEDLREWYGSKGSPWFDKNTRQFLRCITMPGDSELLTRHEILEGPPDILVTNYSMLAYMLMRPIEQPIFDKTASWLKSNQENKFLLVVDEAHMYRGAAGAEVALLLRRLRKRLAVPPDQIQVICTSASFSDDDVARDFAAQLTGKPTEEFVVIKGDLSLRTPEAFGTDEQAQILGAFPLADFYRRDGDNDRLLMARSLLAQLELPVATEGGLELVLHLALKGFPPLNQLVNRTMESALPVSELAELVFPGVAHDIASTAVTVLAALASIARSDDAEAGLLPARIHLFLRGLPGLWACIDPNCSQLTRSERGGPTGALYCQPLDQCECGARVFELFTCRNCGSAYARAYTDDLKQPNFLWNGGGEGVGTPNGEIPPLEALDVLLEEPTATQLNELSDLDLATGRLNPRHLGSRTRSVWISKSRLEVERGTSGTSQSASGEYRPCGICGQSANFGSSVQDHQTKGSQPFQAVIARQLAIQPPSRKVSPFAPLQGRKVLAFSDSRQVAARLAPQLQEYSNRDTVRPLLLFGFRSLDNALAGSQFSKHLSLQHCYLSVLIGAEALKVRLRPERLSGEALLHSGEVEAALVSGLTSEDAAGLMMLSAEAPQELLRVIHESIVDRWLGLQALALASLEPSPLTLVAIGELPALSGLSESQEQKIALVRGWLSAWQRSGVWIPGMPQDFWENEVRPNSGKFPSSFRKALGGSAKLFEQKWLPTLLEEFTEVATGNKRRLKGSRVTLSIAEGWEHCAVCKNTQRPGPVSGLCLRCGLTGNRQFDPETDEVFQARKGYYRRASVAALRDDPESPMALVAAEHTAQLNAADNDQIFSEAEQNELLFQDVQLGPDDAAIDVLSCTTTMEVGIDIGNLSGVALRNMPPARANYQQRAGRAGRRGRSLATVTAFGSSDSHDEHYFQEPDEMIRGDVSDPVLNLDNRDIAKRHILAFLLLEYHRSTLTGEETSANLFDVLGSVSDFLSSSAPLSRDGFEKWLSNHADDLSCDLDDWLPVELQHDVRRDLLDHFIELSLESLDDALHEDSTELEGQSNDSEIAHEGAPEAGDPETDSDRHNLLGRLLHQGVLPRFAFPTDVATFYVFSPDSDQYRPTFRYSPSQSRAIALSQYAPGKEVWIGGRRWTSGAIYSPFSRERYGAWRNRSLYLQCGRCGYASIETYDESKKGEVRDCTACGAHGDFGPAQAWLKPPGFAHPFGQAEILRSDDSVPPSYATRAKLLASAGEDPTRWKTVTERIRTLFDRGDLLVSNTGPKEEGYRYCTQCGRIEPTTIEKSGVRGGHQKPYPDKDQNCPGDFIAKGIVLGTSFVTDVLLISLRVDEPISLFAGALSTKVALRTLSEALSKAACDCLELDPGELQAEFRPALSPLGPLGLEAESYLYDTLPGGAGFSRAAQGLGGELFERAKHILDSCPNGCDRSCYGCLRSFKNKFEHELLDRHLASSLCGYLLGDNLMKFDPGRVKSSTDLLWEELCRWGGDDRFSRDVEVDVPGRGTVLAPILVQGEVPIVVGLSHPLANGQFLDDDLTDVAEFSAVPVIDVDELLTRVNLPQASLKVIERL